MYGEPIEHESRAVDFCSPAELMICQKQRVEWTKCAKIMAAEPKLGPVRRFRCPFMQNEKRYLPEGCLSSLVCMALFPVIVGSIEGTGDASGS